MDMAKLMAKINAKKKEFVKNERPVSPKPGINKIVILPGWNPANPETFWREFGAHFIKNPDGTTAGFYPCDEVIFGRECPVCQALAQASRMTSDDATLDLLKKARAGTQFLINAIVIGENGNNPVVFSLSKTAFEQLMNVICSWGQAVFDPSAPQVVEINRTGTGFDTRYMVTVTPESTLRRHCAQLRYREALLLPILIALLLHILLEGLFLRRGGIALQDRAE